MMNEYLRKLYFGDPDVIRLWGERWKAKGQEWRTEPEIDEERQKYLERCITVTGDASREQHPFRDIPLHRADVEWLLSRHLERLTEAPEVRVKDWSHHGTRIIEMTGGIEGEGFDLSGADLREADLSALPLKYTYLNEAHLEEAYLKGAHLEEAHLEEAHLKGANLDEVNLSKAHLKGAHLEGAHLEGAHLEGAHLEGAHLEGPDPVITVSALLEESFGETQSRLERGSYTGANLSKANLRKAHLNEADLRRANLREAHLEEANLEKAHLENACLEAAILSGVYLGGARLKEVDLSRAVLNEVHLNWKYLSSLGTQPTGVEINRRIVLESSGNAELVRANLSEAHLEGVDLSKIHLDGANLSKAHLTGADLSEAHLDGANLSKAYLDGSNFSKAHLTGADLSEAHLDWAHLDGAHLEGADLSRTTLEGVVLDGITLADNNHVGPQVADIRWGETNLTVVDWSQIAILGDEHRAYQKQDLDEYKTAVRANRQLAVVLEDQGLNENAAHFAYRAQNLQRKVLWKQRSYWKWLGSAILALLAGYGYRMWHILVAYVVVVILCAMAYFVLGIYYAPHLSFLEALLTSITAFHGRVFSEPFLQPGEPQLWVTAFEAVAGLVIEGVFIAMLAQKFFGK